jgi:glucose-1-phosphate thymidylyltransferase
MIYYPLQTLLDAGIKDIMIVAGRGYAGHFLELLGSGEEFGARFTYKIQEEAGGIAQALGLAKNWVDDENVAVILGDNIFENDMKSHVEEFKSGAKIFLKWVERSNRFGVPRFRDDKSIIYIEEKPRVCREGFAVTGFYLYDSDVFKYIEKLKPSGRGELEITDINNKYAESDKLHYAILKGYWSDAGTFESLLQAGTMVKEKLG